MATMTTTTTTTTTTSSSAAEELTQDRGSSRRIRRGPVLAVQTLIIVAFLLGWEYLAGRPGDRFAIVDEFYVGRPGLALKQLRTWASDGTLWSATAVTLKEALTGFAVGCLTGLLAGVLLGVSPLLSKILMPFVIAGNTVPKLALAPLLILWFGLGSSSKIALAALVVFFLVFMNTFTGVMSVDKDLLNAMRVMGARPRHLHFLVTLPSAMVWVIAGLRVSIPYAFLATVVGQMLAAREGLGVLIQRSSANFNPSAMFAAIFVLVMLSMLLNVAVTIVERRVLRWRAV